MKQFKKIAAVLLVAALLGNFVACTKKTAAGTSASVTTSVTDASQASSSDSTTQTVDLSDKSFDTLYGSQLKVYLNHNYTINGTEIPVAESDYYFVEAFVYLSQIGSYQGYPTTTLGYLDLSATIDESFGLDAKYVTWGDFFLDYATKTIQSIYISCGLAGEEGLELSDDTNAEIDEYVENLRTDAGTAGMDLDSYLKLFYGDACGETVFKEILSRYYLAGLYSDDYKANFAENCDTSEYTVPVVRHVLFSAPIDTSTEDELAAAKQSADDFLAGLTSVDDLATQGQALYDSNGCLEYAEYDVPKGMFVSEFEDWAYDESRQPGDMEVIQTDYGYHVVGYVGTEVDEDAINEAAEDELNDYIGSIVDGGTYEISTTDEIGTPEAETMTIPTDTSTGDNGTIVDDAASSDVSTTSAAGDSTTSKTINTKTILIVVAVAIVLGILFLITYIVSDNEKKSAGASQKDKPNDASSDSSIDTTADTNDDTNDDTKDDSTAEETDGEKNN